MRVVRSRNGLGGGPAAHRIARGRIPESLTSSPDSGSQVIAVVGYLVEQAQHAIERADSKAATLIATATAVVAISAQGTHWRAPDQAWNLALELTTAGALLWLTGIVTTAFAIFPRLRGSDSPGSTLSFTGYPKDFDPAAVRSRLPTDEPELEQLLMEQAHVLSRIAVAKYRFIRYGMVLLGAGAVLIVAGITVR